MPRSARSSQGGYCYHILNRGNGRHTVFHKEGDYAAFLKLLRQAGERVPVRLLAYCPMPIFFHLALWPREDGKMSAYMGWLLTAHVRRYHQHYHSSGHVWQGRFKAFVIQEDEHLLAVLRYIERNPLRANLVGPAQDWRWSSAPLVDPGAPVRGNDASLTPDAALLFPEQPGSPRPLLDVGPVPRPEHWLDYVNAAQTQAELERLQECVRRGRPFGEDHWIEETARRLGLESSMRPRGRPRKAASPPNPFGDEP